MSNSSPMQPREQDLGGSVAARWTDRLAQTGWTPISDIFLDNYSRLQPRITNQEAVFVIHLVRFKWTRQAPYPGFTTLARKMGVTATMARNYARRLEQKGYLVRDQQSGGTNRFDLTPLYKQLEATEARLRASKMNGKERSSGFRQNGLPDKEVS